MPGPNPALDQVLRDLLQLGPLSGLLGGSGAAGSAAGGAKALLGNDVIKAILLWQVLGQIAGPLLEPLSTEIAQSVWGRFPGRVLSPAELADMVVRAVVPLERAAGEAAQSGVDPERFGWLWRNAGEPIPLQSALLAWRRGVIPEAGDGPEAVSLEQVIRESRLKNKYIPVVKSLQWEPLSAAEWVAAWLRGQVSEAQALEGARIAGTPPEAARIMYDSAGRPPSPTELMALLHRGLIPLEGVGPGVKSFQQGIYEGDSKDKWWTEYAALAEHLPPPRSIVALLRSGAMSDQLARDLLQRNGLSAELAAIYVADAHHQRTSTQHELTVQQVLSARAERLISEETALRMLVTLHYPEASARLLLAEREAASSRAALASAITRTRTLFVGHRITRVDAEAALAAFGLPADAIAAQLRIWVLERRSNVRLLTPAEVGRSWQQGYLDDGAALGELEALGYSPRDAWLVLAHHGRGVPHTPMPAQTVSGDELSPAR